MTIKLKTVVSGQLPDFVREDYPLFTEFLEAYYDYLDQYEKRDLNDIRDLDNTVDSFIAYFKSELNIFGESSYDNIDQQLLLRKIKELYTSKGAEPAYKFLFKVLFNKNADISYPWNQVLKASDGKWKQETSIFVQIDSGNAEDLPGNNITIFGTNTRVKVYVERVALARNNVYEVFINKNYYGSINVNDTVKFGTFSGKIIPTTVKYVIENPGSGYKIGDIITASTIAGTTTINSLLKVTQINSNGGIVKLSTIKFGAGYSDDFFVLAAKSSFTNSSSITISKNAIQQFSIPDNSYLEKYTDFGYVINPNFAAVPYSDPTYAGTLLREFYTDTLNNQTSTNYSLIRFVTGAVAKYQGYYTSNDGFLDDAIKIQDSYYYQKYSYLITIDERLSDYKTILKSYIHAAGTALFGEYQIQNAYAPGISGELFVDEYKSKATFTTINKNITNEFILTNDTGGRIRIDPYDAENYFDATYNPETYQNFTG